MGDVDAERAQLIISSQLNPPQYDLLELRGRQGCEGFFAKSFLFFQIGTNDLKN